MRFPGVVDTLKIGIGAHVDLGNIVLTGVWINRTEQVTPSIGGRWAALLCHGQSSQHLLRSLNGSTTIFTTLSTITVVIISS